MPALLDAAALMTAMADLPDWSADGRSIRRTVELPSFAAAVQAVDGAAEVAEELDHHPDIDLRYRTVTFRLSTHSAGGVTELDLTSARRIDELLDALS